MTVYLDTIADLSDEAYKILRSKHSETDIRYLMRKGALLELEKEIAEITKATDESQKEQT